MIAATKNYVMMADKLGKIKATFQDISIAGYILYAFLVTEFTLSSTLNAVFALTLLVLFGITVILTIVSGVNYFVKNKALLKSKKEVKKED